MENFKHGRYKSAIIEFLQEEREANSCEIHTELIERYRQGPTMNQITNILAKSNLFSKVMDGFKPRMVRVKSNLRSGGYNVHLWTLKDRKTAELYLRNFRDSKHTGGRPKITN